MMNVTGMLQKTESVLLRCLRIIHDNKVLSAPQIILPGNVIERAYFINKVLARHDTVGNVVVRDGPQTVPLLHLNAGVVFVQGHLCALGAGEGADAATQDHQDGYSCENSKCKDALLHG